MSVTDGCVRCVCVCVCVCVCAAAYNTAVTALFNNFSVDFKAEQLSHSHSVTQVFVPGLSISMFC